MQMRREFLPNRTLDYGKQACGFRRVSRRWCALGAAFLATYVLGWVCVLNCTTVEGMDFEVASQYYRRRFPPEHANGIIITLFAPAYCVDFSIRPRYWDFDGPMPATEDN